MIHKSIYLTAKQAADSLGVTLPTLYAYASRGQLRSEPAGDRSRERRYFREDIERLRERKEARRDPSKAAARGLHWGSAVLESGLTLIQEGRLFYRGQDALKLAEWASLEQVAELLWSPEPAEQGQLFNQPSVLSPSQLRQVKKLANRDPLVLLQTALPLAAAVDVASHDLRPAAVRLTGARILRLFGAIVARPLHPLHVALQAAWAPGKPAVADVIRTALVLCADHELNASAFVARCAASAGASPYDVVSAALATLKGHKHGGVAQHVAALFDEIDSPKRARVVIANRLRRGEGLPGFGHPLYPEGDPRAPMLFKLAEAGGNEQQWRFARSIARAASDLFHDAPNLDFALQTIARTYDLPEPAPLLLFALGRTVGWMGHAIEQYASNELIRPRARYIGPMPQAPSI